MFSQMEALNRTQYSILMVMMIEAQKIRPKVKMGPPDNAHVRRLVL